MTKDFLTFQSYDPRYGLGPFTLCLSLICGHSENEILLLKMQFCSYHCTAGAVNHNEHEINASDQIMVLHCFLPCLRQNQSWLKAPPLRDFACIHGSGRDILLQLSIKGPDQVGRLAHMPRVLLWGSCDSQTKPENAHCHVRSMKWALSSLQ